MMELKYNIMKVKTWSSTSKLYCFINLHEKKLIILYDCLLKQINDILDSDFMKNELSYNCLSTKKKMRKTFR